MRVADANAAVLLLGETGTGKELVAQASPRRGGPFVAADCAGLTETLFESELFGYEKGAFTGAGHRKLGLVEATAGGTLFGELPLSLQVKLLGLLETGTYRRVGGLDSLSAGFRLDEPVDLATLEERYLDWLLPRLGNDVAVAARRLGVSARTLYRKRQGRTER